MKEKTAALVLGLALIFGLAGCGVPAGDKTASAEEGTVGLANPVQDSTKEEIRQLDGVVMEEPEGASDVRYSRITTEPVIDQMQFSYDGDDCCYRIAKTDELQDISGMYYEWESEPVMITSDFGYEIRTSIEGAGVCQWYADGHSYSVSVTENATKEKLETLFMLLYGNAGVLV